MENPNFSPAPGSEKIRNDSLSEIISRAPTNPDTVKSVRGSGSAADSSSAGKEATRSSTRQTLDFRTAINVAERPYAFCC
jgi:hypothetical protein